MPKKGDNVENRPRWRGSGFTKKGKNMLRILWWKVFLMHYVLLWVYEHWGGIYNRRFCIQLKSLWFSATEDHQQDREILFDVFLCFLPKVFLPNVFTEQQWKNYFNASNLCPGIWGLGHCLGINILLSVSPRLHHTGSRTEIKKAIHHPLPL